MRAERSAPSLGWLERAEALAAAASAGAPPGALAAAYKYGAAAGGGAAAGRPRTRRALGPGGVGAGEPRGAPGTALDSSPGGGCPPARLGFFDAGSGNAAPYSLAAYSAGAGSHQALRAVPALRRSTHSAAARAYRSRRLGSAAAPKHMEGSASRREAIRARAAAEDEQRAAAEAAAAREPRRRFSYASHRAEQCEPRRGRRQQQRTQRRAQSAGGTAHSQRRLPPQRQRAAPPQQEEEAPATSAAARRQFRASSAPRKLAASPARQQGGSPSWRSGGKTKPARAELVGDPFAYSAYGALDGTQARDVSPAMRQRRAISATSSPARHASPWRPNGGGTREEYRRRLALWHQSPAVDGAEDRAGAATDVTSKQSPPWRPGGAIIPKRVAGVGDSMAYYAHRGFLDHSQPYPRLPGERARRARSAPRARPAPRSEARTPPKVARTPERPKSVPPRARPVAVRTPTGAVTTLPPIKGPARASWVSPGAKLRRELYAPTVAQARVSPAKSDGGGLDSHVSVASIKSFVRSEQGRFPSPFFRGNRARDEGELRARLSQSVALVLGGGSAERRMAAISQACASKPGWRALDPSALLLETAHGGGSKELGARVRAFAREGKLVPLRLMLEAIAGACAALTPDVETVLISGLANELDTARAFERAFGAAAVVVHLDEEERQGEEEDLTLATTGVSLAALAHFEARASLARVPPPVLRGERGDRARAGAIRRGVTQRLRSSCCNC